MAFAKTLETVWTRAGLNMITLQQCSHLPQDIGKLTGHKEKTLSQGNVLTLFCVLYVDYFNRMIKVLKGSSLHGLDQFDIHPLHFDWYARFVSLDKMVLYG